MHSRAISTLPRPLSLSSTLFSSQLCSESQDLRASLVETSQRNLKTDTDFVTDTLKRALLYEGTVFIVIDGLDEVEEIERKRLLYLLRDILKDCQDTRLYISSREEVDIARIISTDATTVSVDRRNVESIQAYVSKRFKDWMEVAEFEAQAKEELKGLLSVLAPHSQGTFGKTLALRLPSNLNYSFPRDVSLCSHRLRQY